MELNKLIENINTLIDEFEHAEKSVRYCRDIQEVVKVYGDKVQYVGYDFVDVRLKHTLITFVFVCHNIIHTKNCFEVFNEKGVHISYVNYEELKVTLEYLNKNLDF